MKLIKGLFATAIAAIAMILAVVLLVLRFASQSTQAPSQVSSPNTGPAPTGKTPGSSAAVPLPSVPPPGADSDPDEDATNRTRTYRLRILDDASNTPISHASVVVEISMPTTAKRTGATNDNGVFEFTADINSRYKQAFLTVNARGFVPLQEYSPLVEDRLIHLSRAK